MRVSQKKSGGNGLVYFILGCQRVFCAAGCAVEKLMHFVLLDSETSGRMKVVIEKQILKNRKGVITES